MIIEKITIQSIYQSDSFKATVEININNKIEELWFEAEKKFADAFCDDRIDGIVAMMLLRCMKQGENIYSKIPISAKLHHQLITQLIPILSEYSGGQLKIIKIDAPLTTKVYGGKKIAGTGLSCGVDSLYTVMKFSDNTIDEQFRIKQLLIAQTDSVISRHEYSNRYSINCNRAIEFANEYGYSCLCVNTNFRDFYGGNIIGYTGEVTFMMCGIALLFSKSFGVYYFSGARSIDHLTIEPPKSSEAYNLVILPLLSTENLSFYLGGLCDRLQKEKELSHYKPSYKYLNVCWHYTAAEHINCGCCGKCRKTLLAFDLLGCIDKYSKIFNINEYYKQRNKIWAELIAGDFQSLSEKEIYEAAVDEKFQFPKESVIIANGIKRKKKAERFRSRIKQLLKKLLIFKHNK